MTVGEILKKHGLDLAEDVTREIAIKLFEALPEIAEVTETKVDDAIMSALPMMKPFLMEMIDKIDGKEGWN